MLYEFNSDDVFEMAEQMEKNGAKFYHQAAAGLPDSPAKALLERLAKMEKAHEKIFASMRAELSAQEKESTVFDPEGEATLYLRAYADTRVFFEKEIDVSSLEKVFKSAIEAEKDAIVFYLGIKDGLAEKSAQERIDVIIKEEMGHFSVLSRELLALRRDS